MLGTYKTIELVGTSSRSGLLSFVSPRFPSCLQLQFGNSDEGHLPADFLNLVLSDSGCARIPDSTSRTRSMSVAGWNGFDKKASPFVSAKLSFSGSPDMMTT